MNSKKDLPRVSFILGILNAERTLEECLNGICIQDYPRDYFEVIIIDGGSTDKTLQIIDSFMHKEKNISLLHNPKKLSEGRGMSKDMGIQKAKGDIVILLDHDNLISDPRWLRGIVLPFRNKQVMASQSLLEFRKEDSNFLKYINAAGVEDPFAIPYSLVAQVQLYPHKFQLEENAYYLHRLNPNSVLFGGANGCAFVKEVFEKIGGYTRDVDVFAKMAEHRMLVAVPKHVKLYHKTASNLWTFMKKKGLYFYRFINKEYAEKDFQWVKPGFANTLRFFLMVASNLSFAVPSVLAFQRTFKTGRLFWLLHPFYVFFVTLEYGLITLLKLKNFFSYARIKS
ncbi:MAG: glycosyltransferase [Nanoarchaeota archaeon]